MNTTIENCDLGVGDLLYRCNFCVPVNCRVETAIDAHRQSMKDGTEPRTGYALRAVVMAMTPTLDDARRQLDYLTDLPEKAWPSIEHREETLRAMARNIAWRMQD